MPRYDFNCRAHGAFEVTVERGCSSQPCPTCGIEAPRELSVPFIAGATVSRNIPEPEYRKEASRRESRRSGWDVDRAVREMRKNISVDAHGEKAVRLKG